MLSIQTDFSVFSKLTVTGYEEVLHLVPVDTQLLFILHSSNSCKGLNNTLSIKWQCEENKKKMYTPVTPIFTI